MLPDDPLPIGAPSEFSPAIERDLRKLLAIRLGREGTTDELQGYRQLLWAFALAKQAINRQAVTADPSLFPNAGSRHLRTEIDGIRRSAGPEP
jgi:hypothetical protein